MTDGTGDAVDRARMPSLRWILLGVAGGLLGLAFLLCATAPEPASGLAICGTIDHASIWPDFSAPMIAPTFCSGLKLISAPSAAAIFEPI